jgi:rod shape-determining protein MreC
MRVNPINPEEQTVLNMKRVNLVALAIFLVLVVVVLALSPRNTQRIQSGFLGVITPFLKTGSSLQNRFLAFQQGLQTLEELEKDNHRLKVQNKELMATNQTLRG